MSSSIDILRERIGAVTDIRSAVALLGWDQEVYMPPKGAEARSYQLATLSSLAHRLFTDSEVGDLLASLNEQRDSLNAADAALVDVGLYDYERAKKLPESFVHEFTRVCSVAYEAWVQARAKSDFKAFQPHLESVVALNRQKADLLGYEGSPYNALLEDFERGMTTEKLRVIFGDLAPKQSVLIERLLSGPKQPDLSWIQGEWDVQTQWDFGMEVLRDFGYDFEAGRQDKSVHPFSTIFDIRDVRITTRMDASDPFSALTGTMHECGHALYMQGHSPEDARTPVADGPSLGMHESQSRMWENIIGRSLPFWEHYAPKLRARFPGRLDNVSPEQIYAALNRVEPSLIRVEADECTYNLHIIVRFELEVALLEGALSVADVSGAWNEKIKRYLGLDVPNDAQGCLQDIHWSHGAFGYFPTYALGNLYASQLFEAIARDIPTLWNEVRAGQFGALLSWLREKIHRHGRRKLGPELMRSITGSELDAEPYLRYLKTKYEPLYGI